MSADTQPISNLTITPGLVLCTSNSRKIQKNSQALIFLHKRMTNNFIQLLYRLIPESTIFSAKLNDKKIKYFFAKTHIG